jgi:CRP-like cAMP-binding protein
MRNLIYGINLMAGNDFKNYVLRHLDTDVIRRLQLRRVDLPVRHDLEVPGQAIRNLFFIEAGIGSMTTAFENGVQVETSMFGCESVIGVSALMGVKRSLNGTFMQLPGHGYSCDVARAAEEFRTNGLFQQLALRYVQAQLTISTQNAACNATHTYEQRLARWLLICSDRSGLDSMDMAQEFVSEMLGSTRSTVSIAAAHLKAKGLIDYRRGTIMLLHKDALEREACECYRVVRNHLESLDSFDPGFAV